MLQNKKIMESEFISQILRSSNHYQVLGVSKSSSADEIKKAYRKLASKVHPDRCKEAKATEAFQKLSQAYQILSDENKRRIYDACGDDDNFGMGSKQQQDNFYSYKSNFGFGNGGDHYSYFQDDDTEILRSFFNRARSTNYGQNVRYTFTDGRGNYYTTYGNPFKQRNVRAQKQKGIFDDLFIESDSSGILILFGFVLLCIIFGAMFLIYILKPNYRSNPLRDLKRHIIFPPLNQEIKSDVNYLAYKTHRLKRPFLIPRTYIKKLQKSNRKHFDNSAIMLRLYKEADNIYIDWIKQKCKEEINHKHFGASCHEMSNYSITL